MPKLQNIDWYALIDTLLGVEFEYELEVTDNHITIITAPEHFEVVQDQLKIALDSVTSVIPYSMELAPLQESVSEALRRFKALLGQERFTDIAINPDELFNEKKGAAITNGILYSKPTNSKKTIAVWTKAIDALITDLSSHSKEQLKSLWQSGTAIARDTQADSKNNVDYHDLVRQNFGLREDEAKNVSVFFNFRQLWQDLFFSELAEKSQIIQTPSIKGSRENAQFLLNKAHLLDYLRQELQSDVLWRIFQGDSSPVATPLYLDTTRKPQQKIRVSIIIDRSGSMQNIFNSLTDNILEFIKKLQPTTEVNILFFDDNLGPRRTFQASDLKGITAFVKSEKPKGNTYLYKALELEFNELLKKAAAGDNTAVLLLTDGADATPNQGAAINNILACQQLFKQNGIRVPKIFTVGIGDERQIQTLDARLAGERLIINKLTEFNKVFQYIHEIQYPLVEHSLVITTKPEQLSAYKVTYQQDTNVQSPDIYITFENDVIGIIGDHYKQIIRLNGKHTFANVHDLVKGTLAKSREMIATKPSVAKSELASMHRRVTQLSEEPKSAYEKATLGRLAELLEQSQLEPLEDVRQQQRYLEQKVNKLEFSMEYSPSLLFGQHYTVQGHVLPDSQYNIAGKLISGFQQPVVASSLPVQLITKTNTEQNQMTVHAMDSHQTEQNRLYADCIPMVGEFNEAPYLHCQSDAFQAYVFPHQDTHHTPGDNYNLSSCRPIHYYGMPSVTCDGENSSVVIAPHVKPAPFENLSANVALGAVIVYWCKQLYQRFTCQTVEPAKEFLTDKNYFQQKVKNMVALLNKTQKKVNQAKSFDATNFFLSEIEDFHENIKKCQKKFLKGTLEKSVFNEFLNEIETFTSDVLKECEHATERRTPITPQFVLAQKTDWGTLIEHHPISVNRNIPIPGNR